MNPKNKGGRPPRAKGEKLQRINVTLRPGVLFGLEMLARHRNISLSQAVEFAFTAASRDYEIEDIPLSKIAQIVNALGEETFTPTTFDAHDGKEHSVEEQREIAGAFFRATGLHRIMAMPPSLRLAIERYFLAVFEVPGPGYWTEGELFRELAEKGFSENASPESVAAEWRRQCRLKFGATSRPKRPKKR